MTRAEQRRGDSGPEGRRLFDLKTVSILVALLINFGAIMWKGGQISGQFETLIGTVSDLKTQAEEIVKNQSNTTTSLTVQGVLINGNIERLEKHEKRLERIENTPSIREWKR